MWDRAEFKPVEDAHKFDTVTEFMGELELANPLDVAAWAASWLNTVEIEAKEPVLRSDSLERDL